MSATLVWGGAMVNAYEVKAGIVMIVLYSILFYLRSYLCGRECKIIRDQQTLKSKGYGFVSFVNREVRFALYVYEMLQMPVV